ncbi:hypothetical protein [Kitasatospora sp. NPDC048538]|uniref:hypothetical protein n=1 Tax=unclassified Kitasatospora TaxID=2633591 RepID=UPI00340235B8
MKVVPAGLVALLAALAPAAYPAPAAVPAPAALPAVSAVAARAMVAAPAAPADTPSPSPSTPPAPSTSPATPTPAPTSPSDTGSGTRQPALGLVPARAPQLGTVQVTVSGFGACRTSKTKRPTIVQVTWDDPAGVLATIGVDGDNPSTGTIKVPPGSGAGPHTVTATCQGPATRADATAVLTVAPATLTADPPQGAAGSRITVTGAGFACPAGDTAALTWDGTPLPDQGRPDGGGGFATAVTVPRDAAAGDHDVRASCGSEAGIAATARVRVRAVAPTPPVTPTPPGPTSREPDGTSTATPGTALSLSGPTDGCPRGGGPPWVVLSWDGGPRSHPIQADGSGRVHARATIPPDAPLGPHTITVECADTHAVTQTVPVLVARQVPQPGSDRTTWIVLGAALATAALAALALRHLVRGRRPAGAPSGTPSGTSGTPGRVTAEIGARWDMETKLTETERGGDTRTGRVVRLEPRPDPGRQSLEEPPDDRGSTP